MKVEKIYRTPLPQVANGDTLPSERKVNRWLGNIDYAEIIGNQVVRLKRRRYQLQKDLIPQ